MLEEVTTEDVSHVKESQMRMIAIEEAFSVKELLDRCPGLYDLGDIPISEQFGQHCAERLPDFASWRIPEMDRYGVDMQVLSLTAPGIQAALPASDAVAAARFANDYLADVIATHPGRFAGFAALPTQDPSAAVTELRRAVSELGLSGALINDHPHGHYLDDPIYDPLWSTLEDLDVPLYLHPGAVPQDRWPVLDGCRELNGALFSWGAQTGAHALRILFAGVFDRHPRVTLILGHMGEYLPFMLSRLDSRYATLDPGRTLRRRPSEYIGANIVLTTSGVQSPAALTGAILAVGADAIMFAVDYPYETTASATAAFAGAALSDGDRHKIAHGNAERRLKLGV